MFLKTNKTFLVSLGVFLGVYMFYAFATKDYIEGFSAKRPQLWTVFRLSTVICVSLAAFIVSLASRKMFHIGSYAIASVAGGIWLLVAPFWYQAFKGFSGGFPVGAALSYGALSGFFGASVRNYWYAALFGLLILIAQLSIDIVGYFVIVGYAGFH